MLPLLFLPWRELISVFGCMLLLPLVNVVAVKEKYWKTNERVVEFILFFLLHFVWSSSNKKKGSAAKRGRIMIVNEWVNMVLPTRDSCQAINGVGCLFLTAAHRRFSPLRSPACLTFFDSFNCRLEACPGASFHKSQKVLFFLENSSSWKIMLIHDKNSYIS